MLPSFIYPDVDLKGYTSWLVGGKADYLCSPSSYHELRLCLIWAKSQGLPVTVLGGGSNVLISDDGIDGLVILTRKLNQLQSFIADGNLVLRAQSGVKKAELLRVFLKHSLAPAVFLAGLPGEVGGGIVMNAGISEPCVPREFGELVRSFLVMNFDGEERLYSHDQVTWGYRYSSGWQPGIILEAELAWPYTPDPLVIGRVKDANQQRVKKQPLELPSCGSVFVNPPGLKAAALIDSCGLKGYTIGQAQVSTKHANFIVNLGGARAEDIWNLIEYVKATVRENCQVDLETEVVRLGRW
ncbi:MAG: UDP-N-acetylmuramate dehydrogenase [Bdellovibrionaceae bacterium]|nr:UDP-N-acetylmuramate dehydrogenase [Pseudobdellovibrionaceae bacterium]MDW8190486.1 UDP-N-acetylmuramate dehydrogenase [Pseudobdellovibrionaceae bacterium]